MKRFIISIFIALLCQIGLFFFAFSPVSKGLGIPLSGPVAHIVGFGILAIVTIDTLRLFTHLVIVPYILGYLYCLFLIFIVELVQYFLPYRYFDLIDMFYGLVGVIIGMVIILIVHVGLHHLLVLKASMAKK